MAKTHDRRMWKLVKANVNMAVPWYIMASYAYYELDRPILSDGAFDKLSKFLLDHWEEAEHRHKHLITTDMLTAGSFFAPDEGYPLIVQGATEDLIRQLDRKRK